MTIKRISERLAPYQIQRRLLSLAAIFLFLFSIALTFAPAARERSLNVDYLWAHWLGFIVWCIVFTAVQFFLRKRLPDADPYLLPLAAFLSGWGLLTIYRLEPGFGLRQTTWLVVCGVIFILGLHLSPDLHVLRRYKYLWLAGGLLLTALTLVLGTNPLGGGPRLWLGCCGVYFQPSEPLKLLLIIFLAAYLADKLPLSLRPIPLLAPTAAVTGLALTLLLVQHDLGTASIFIFLYTIILFVASGKKRVLWISLAGLAVAVVSGYHLFDVVRLRVDAWLNPWSDPSGGSYQIIQSLIAIANGGIFGRGPGLGSPRLVPVAISDFIFAAIAEEIGLVGTIGLLILLGMILARGIRIALRAPDRFRRILAAGLTAYLIAQSILIIGGNLRLLPLTGVTLPFVSYGGSSLLTSFIALLLLLITSSQPEDEPATLPSPKPHLLVSGFLTFGLLVTALVNGWWGFWRGPDLLTRTDNPRRSISDRYVKRGSLLDSHENLINVSEGESGSYIRIYLYPPLAPVTGYVHATFGQAGLEASLDDYLRGLKGNSASRIWWGHLLYGQPPPGLDVRLSLDLNLQQTADELLGDHTGAVVLLNAETGEILVMASHPTYDPRALDEIGPTLAQDPSKPLLDRAAQGMYPPGEAVSPFWIAAGINEKSSQDEIVKLYTALGFYSTPDLRLPVTEALRPDEFSYLRISPLQMALAAAALSHDGLRPFPRLAMAVNTPTQGWVILPSLGEVTRALPDSDAHAVAEALMASGEPFWEWIGQADQDGEVITWYLGGTLPNWRGAPLAVVVLIEENRPSLAGNIGRLLLKAALQP